MQERPQPNQIPPSVGPTSINKSVGDALNGESLFESNEMKANEIREDMRADNDSEMKTASADKASSKLTGSDTLTGTN